MVPLLQNGAMKWKKKLAGVRSHAVTNNRTLKLKICGEKNQPKFITLYTKLAGIMSWIVARWSSRFCEGQVRIQDDPRSGRPVTAMGDASVFIISTLLEEDLRICEEISYEANMSTTSVFRIMTLTLQKRKFAAK